MDIPVQGSEAKECMTAASSQAVQTMMPVVAEGPKVGTPQDA
ncbi:hypothetical protein [Micromonospora echinofusca]